MYFFDTYALIEIATGNEGYNPYLDFPYVVSALNMGEFYAYLMRTNGMEKARKMFESHHFEKIELNKKLMMEAAEFKSKHSKRNLSWADCIGYAAAKQLKLKFLTGDKEFKDMENVVFVK